MPDCKLRDACRCVSEQSLCPNWGVWEMFEGNMMKVINGDRAGWWRFHDHYDRDGYCDNPGRGY